LPLLESCGLVHLAQHPVGALWLEGTLWTPVLLMMLLQHLQQCTTHQQSVNPAGPAWRCFSCCCTDRPASDV